MTQPRSRNRAGEGHHLRSELIAAAGRVLAAAPDGADLSLRAVAREAGIAAPSVYLQFDDKAALVRAVLHAGFNQLRITIETAVALEAAPANRLRIGCYAYCAFAHAHPGVYRTLFVHTYADAEYLTDDAGSGEASARALGTLVDAIAECMAAGLTNPGDPFRHATLVWPALHGYVMLKRRRFAFPWLPMPEQIEDLLVGLVGIPRLPSAALTAMAAKVASGNGPDPAGSGAHAPADVSPSQDVPARTL